MWPFEVWTMDGVPLRGIQYLHSSTGTAYTFESVVEEANTGGSFGTIFVQSVGSTSKYSWNLEKIDGKVIAPLFAKRDNCENLKQARKRWRQGRYLGKDYNSDVTNDTSVFPYGVKAGDKFHWDGLGEYVYEIESASAEKIVVTDEDTDIGVSWFPSEKTPRKFPEWIAKYKEEQEKTEKPSTEDKFPYGLRVGDKFGGEGSSYWGGEIVAIDLTKEVVTTRRKKDGILDTWQNKDVIKGFKKHRNTESSSKPVTDVGPGIVDKTGVFTAALNTEDKPVKVEHTLTESKLTKYLNKPKRKSYIGSFKF